MHHATSLANSGIICGGVGITVINITTFVYLSQDHFDNFFIFFRNIKNTYFQFFLEYYLLFDPHRTLG
jgi:hypothetical protein